jgi:hypothetical protein
MAYEGLTVEYMVKTTGDQWFVPGNCQAPTNSHDNPDNGTKAQRLAQCGKLSPDGVEKVVS